MFRIGDEVVWTSVLGDDRGRVEAIDGDFVRVSYGPYDDEAWFPRDRLKLFGPRNPRGRTEG